MNQGIRILAEEITSLQRGYTSYRDEVAIVQKISEVRGRDLTQLKLALDGGSDHRDLIELVLHDIDNDSLRNELLQHIDEASPTWAETGQPYIKLLSDVDDTLYASLHDSRFPKGTLYPGILELHQALQRSSEKNSNSLASLTLLTARPRDAMGVVERLTQRQLRGKGMSSVTVLGGSFFALRSHGAMAQRKLENFSLYQRLFPEFDFVFIGDNGQGDLSLGEMMLDLYPKRMSSVYIHDVKQTGSSHDHNQLHYFGSYLEMAIDLCQQGLLSLEDCERVSVASTRDLNNTAFSNSLQARAAFDAHSIQQERLRLLTKQVA